MLKVFRLLRNNGETGPFTIGELLQQKLVSSDLVWVDGESTAWAHPQEMPNLKYAVTLLPKKEEKKTCPAQAEQIRPGTVIKKEDGGKKAPAIVPLKKAPKDEIERKAEELRQRTLAYKKTPDYQPHNWAHQSSPVISLPENEVDIIYHKKGGLPVGEIMMGSMIVALLALGWYGGGKSMFQPHKEEANAVAVKMISTQDNTANGNSANLSVMPQVLPLKNRHELTTDSLHKKDTARTLTFKPLHKKISQPKKDSDLVVKAPPQVLASTTEPTHVKKEEQSTALQQPKQQETKPTETKESVVPVTAEETPPASTDKKKTIGQVLKGLFKKKRKEEQNPSEEAKPIGN